MAVYRTQRKLLVTLSFNFFKFCVGNWQNVNYKLTGIAFPHKIDNSRVRN